MLPGLDTGPGSRVPALGSASVPAATDALTPVLPEAVGGPADAVALRQQPTARVKVEAGMGMVT